MSIEYYTSFALPNGQDLYEWNRDLCGYQPSIQQSPNPICRPSDSTVHQRILDLTPGPLQRLQWQPEAVTTRLDFIHLKGQSSESDF